MKKSARSFPTVTLALQLLGGSLALATAGCADESAGCALGVCAPSVTPNQLTPMPVVNDPLVPTKPDNGPMPMPPPPEDNSGPPAGDGTWTVFIYGHGDHNLSPSLARDLGEMNAATLSSKVQVIFLADWDSTREMNKTEKYPTGAFWYRIRGGDQEAELIGTEDELNLDDPAVLAATVKTAFKKYPAQRYGVILWDHGDGWKGGFGGDSQNGTRKGQQMSISAVAGALKNGLAQAGLTGRRLDFLAFDTCLLGNTEVAATMADVSKVLIANAELDFGDGLDFTKTLTWLSQNPGATGAQFAVAESKIWDEHHRAASVDDQLFRSHVALDLDKFAAVTTAVGKLASDPAASSATMARAFFESMPSYLLQNELASPETKRPPTRDLGMILGRIKTNNAAPSLASAADGVARAIAAAKLGGATGELRTEQTGVGIFSGPLAEINQTWLPSYGTLAGAWDRPTGWGRVLGALKSSAPANGPVVEGALAMPAAPSQADPVRVDFKVTGSEAASAHLTLAEWDSQDPDVVMIYGEMATAFISAGQQSAKWLGRTMMLDASPPLQVTMNPWTFSVRGTTMKTSLRLVPGTLKTQDKEYDAGLVVDDQGVASAIQIAVREGANVTLSLAELAKGEGTTTFVPYVEAVNVKTRQGIKYHHRTGVSLTGAPVNFRPVAVGPGNYLINVQAVDVWGNTGVKNFNLTLAASMD